MYKKKNLYFLIFTKKFNLGIVTTKNTEGKVKFYLSISI